MSAGQLFFGLRSVSIAAGVACVIAGSADAGRYASIVVELDGDTVLHARNADEARYPASLTKVMTLYLVFDALKSGRLKPTERLKVSRHAARQEPSKLGVKPGATIRVEDAIRAVVTKSANDVAVVLAERLGGTEAGFARKMNAKAAELGLDHTHFENASGLPDVHQTSTARDLAKLGEAVYRDHHKYYAYFSTPDFVWRKRHFRNHNNLLGVVPGVDGIKTGYTSASGYNLMASAQRGGHRVIAVMLGGATGRSRDEHVADLLEAAFMSVDVASGGAPLELRQRIALTEMQNYDAEDFASMQLKRLGVVAAKAEPGFFDFQQDKLPERPAEIAQGDAGAPGEAEDEADKDVPDDAKSPNNATPRKVSMDFLATIRPAADATNASTQAPAVQAITVDGAALTETGGTVTPVP